MATLVIKTNVAQATDVTVENVVLLNSGGQETFTEPDDLRRFQRSRRLRVLIQDDAHGPGSSTLILNNGSGDIPQVDAEAFLDSLTLATSGPYSVPVRDAAGAETVVLDHDALNGLLDDDHTIYSLADGTRAFTGVVEGVTPTSSAHLTTKSYVDGLVSGLKWLPPVDVLGYLGTRTIAEIDALSPSAGDSVVAGSAGTPAAVGSDLLAIGDIAEYDGSSWKKIVTNAAGFPPDGARALVQVEPVTLFSPLTDGTDEGKIAEWDGASLTPALSSPTDGNALLVRGEGSVNENRQYVYDGTVPSGNWVQFGGTSSAHSSLSDLLWTSSGHTGTASRIASFDGGGAASYLEVGVDVQAFDQALADLSNITAAQGDILYFDSANWVNLAPGTSGQVLTTGGAAANPSWSAGGTIPRTLRVAPSGNVDHNTIKAAVDAAVSGGASNSTPWVVIVYPGEYTEAKITIPAGVVVTTPNGERHSLATVTPSVTTDDLIVMTGGSLIGLNLKGVTDASKALIRCATPGQPSIVTNCSFADTTIGLLVTGAGVTVIAKRCVGTVTVAGEPITEVVRVSAGGTLLLDQFTCSVSSTVAALYGGSNPIDKVFNITGSGTFASLIAMDILVVSNDGAGVSVFVDSGATAQISATTLEDNDIGIQIGSGGSGTTVTVQGCSLASHTTDLQSDSATGVMSVNIVVDALTESFTAGTSFSGQVYDKTLEQTRLIGAVAYEYQDPDGRTVSLPTLFHSFASPGTLTGGAVTDGGGLNADVALGTGRITRDSTDQDVVDVSWAADTLALTAASTNYIYINATTLALVATTSVPSDDAVLLAEVVTDGSAIRFIHDTRRDLVHHRDIVFDYLLAAQKFRLNTGLAVSAGSTATKVDVDAGSYYRADHLNSFAGASDVTFSYFYGTDGATEVASQTDVSITQYDASGTLTAMTSGYFRSDTVILTSDGRVSIIYGTAEYEFQNGAATATAATVPTFMEETGITLARLVIEENVGIVDVVDERPIGIGSGGGGGGVSDHGLLAGLADDDHTQYLLTSGSRAMGGSLDMGANNITNVGTVDGVDVSAHASRHNPGGADALATAAPIKTTVGGSPTAGVAASFARSDHDHGDIAVASQAQGDVLYFNGTNWTRLGAGTSGHVLTTQGAAANPQWAASSGGTLQTAYNGGNSIATASATDILFTLTSGGFTVNGAGAIALGNGATTQIVDLGTGAGVKTVTVGSTTGASTLTARTGTGAMTFTAGGIFDVNATGAVTIDSSGGTIGIGTDAVAQAINVGTGAAARTITIGNSTGASQLNLTAGTGHTNITTGLGLTGVISPTSLATSQNNYNPAGLPTASILRLTSSANVNITGLAGGASGRIIALFNVGTTNTITLVNESASSTAANRFALPNNVTLSPSDSIILRYDGTSSRWRIIGSSKGTQAAGGTKTRFYQFGSNSATSKGQHNTVSVGANGSINLEFVAPEDFQAIVSIQVIMIPGATTASADIDLDSTYGAVGEPFNQHVESDTTVTYNLTVDRIEGLDVSSVFSALTAGDICGVKLKHNSIGGAANYLGIRLNYT